MSRLTSQEHWNEIYEGQKGEVNSTKLSLTLRKSIKHILKFFFGDAIENYTEHILWKGLYTKYLPPTPHLKLLEIGSAPGWNLVKFNRLRRYDTYGIEYSPAGAEANRRRFVLAGINPENVIEADLFSEAIRQKYSGYFDIVMSGGFIEHFSDPHKAVERHLDLLKIGGILVIIIPNFSGMNYWLGRFFSKNSIKMHNLKIMNRKNFLECFDRAKIELVYCNYYGTLYFGLYQVDKNLMKYLIYRFLVRFQIILNIIFNLIFGERGCEHKYVSPYLIFIGRKK